MASAYTSLLSFLLGFFIIALLGAMIARPLSGASPRPFHLILGATAAIAVHSLLMTIVGMAGGLRYSFPVTLGAFLIVAAWYIAYTIRWGGHKRGKFDWSSWRPPDAPTIILIVLLVLFQLLMLLNALAPYINPDAEISHYLFIRNYIESDKSRSFPRTRSAITRRLWSCRYSRRSDTPAIMAPTPRICVSGSCSFFSWAG